MAGASIFLCIKFCSWSARAKDFRFEATRPADSGDARDSLELCGLRLTMSYLFSVSLCSVMLPSSQQLTLPLMLSRGSAASSGEDPLHGLFDTRPALGELAFCGSSRMVLALSLALKFGKFCEGDKGCRRRDGDVGGCED